MFPKIALLFLVVSFSVIPVTGVQAADADPPFELRFPQEPEETHFIDSWRHARSGGRRHQGTDLMAPKMTPVYAIADGVVSVVTSSRLAGRYIGIEHAEGWASYYMHLNNDWPGTNNGRAPWSMTVAPGIEAGSVVKAGELIGWTGDSGNAEGASPHTHFELHRRGRAVNPYPYLKPLWDRHMEVLATTLAMIEEDHSGFIDGRIYLFA